MRAILFDWDGTIVDSIELLYDAYAVVSRRFGLAFDRDIFHRTFAPDWRLMYRHMGLPEEAIEAAGDVWVEAFAGDQVAPFPGIGERLDRLSAAGYGLGLVTGGYPEVILPQLARHDLARFFHACVFGNELPVGKPDPAPLLLALERLDQRLDGSGPPDVRRALEPGLAVYLGDAPDDMRMARAAGVRGVGIPSLVATADELLAAGASETAPSAVDWVDALLARAAGQV